MVPAKRRHGSSAAAVPSQSQRTGPFVSSAAPSSIAQRSQPSRFCPPSRRANPSEHTPSSRLNSIAPSSNPRVSFQQARVTSEASDSAAGPENDADPFEREDDDFMSEVIMAVNVRGRGNVGCCYYIARDERLLLLSDVSGGGLEVVETLKVHIQPTVVLLSLRVEEQVEAYFDSQGRSRGPGDDDDDNAFRLPYVLEFRPSPEFDYDAGKKKLINVQLASDAGTRVIFLTPGENEGYEDDEDGNKLGLTNRQGKVLKLSSLVDMDSRLSIGCAGAVLTYIGRRKAVEYLPAGVNANSSFRISTVETFSIKDTMFVNADTLASLQIIQAESSPNTHSQGPTKASSGSKEGLSVYGLFHHLARTPQGKQLLRQFFLRPSLDLDVINERLDTASVFLRPDNEVPFKNIIKHLGHVKNMRTVMVHLRKGISNGANKGGIKASVWSSLRSFAFYTLQIRDALREVIGAEKRVIGQKIFEQFDNHGLARVGQSVSNIIDFHASAEMHRTVVNPGIDEELDKMKRTYDGIENLLNRISQEIVATIPVQYSLDLNVIFFPQIGFLISISMDPETGQASYEGGEAEEERWERIFSTENRAYYKDQRMRELDNTFGDLYAVICGGTTTDKEIEIVHELGQAVLQAEEMLKCASDICGELDSFLALAQGARMYKYSRPRVTQRNVIDVKGGRHPLQELTVPSYVPNDTFVVGGTEGSTSDLATAGGQRLAAVLSQTTADAGRLEGPSMLMMTGPNYSGKSVYLKQIALIVYMAHIGCYVPADRATIGLTDKILTRIATRETVSRLQSAFMIDLQQVALAMTQATSRSLVIVDEFGKGTESSDGAGLACGVFEYFLGLGDNRPKVLGATHFHEIFENGFLKPRPYLAYGYMEVRFEEQAEDVEDQITYLYNLRSGRKNSSYGTHCAAMNGVDAAIIARSEQLVTLSMQGEDIVAACATISKDEEEDLKDAEATARDFLAQDLRELFGPDTEGDLPVHQPRNILDKVIATE